jgi:hypothetical protein
LSSTIFPRSLLRRFNLECPGTNILEPQVSVKMMDALLEMAAEVKSP